LHRLKLLLEELATAKDDDQQRSWILHEDEQTLKDNLSELAGILVSISTLTVNNMR
jgi:hypothetical protein